MPRPSDNSFRTKPLYFCCEHCIMEYDEYERRMRCIDAIENGYGDGERCHYAPCPEGCQT